MKKPLHLRRKNLSSWLRKPEEMPRWNRILGEADEQAKKIKEAARKDVELDREKAMKEMQSEVAGLALTAVSRILQEGTDPQSDGALYEQFLKKAGEANDTDR